MGRSSAECDSSLKLLKRLCRACNFAITWTEYETKVLLPDEMQPRTRKSEVVISLKNDVGEELRLIHKCGIPFTRTMFGETLEDAAEKFLEMFLIPGNDLETRCPEWKCKRDFLQLEDGFDLSMERLDIMLSLRGF